MTIRAKALIAPGEYQLKSPPREREGHPEQADRRPGDMAKQS